MKKKNKNSEKFISQKAIRQINGFMVDSNYPHMIHQMPHRSRSLNHISQPHDLYKEYSVNPFNRFSVHNKENEIFDFNKQESRIIEEVNEEDRETDKNKILKYLPQLTKNLNELPIQTVQVKDEDLILSKTLMTMKKSESPYPSLSTAKNIPIETVNEVREDEGPTNQPLEHSPRLKMVTDNIEDSYLNDANSAPDTNHHYMHSIHTGLDKLTDNGKEFVERNSEFDPDSEEKLFFLKCHIDEASSNHFTESSHRIVPVVDKLEDSIMGTNNQHKDLNTTPSLKFLSEDKIKEEASSKEEEQNKVKSFDLEEAKLIVDEIDDKEILKKRNYLGWENIKDFSKIEEKDEYTTL
jgi:hypothetical protein